MKILLTVIVATLLSSPAAGVTSPSSPPAAEILAVILASNEEHILPNFFGYFERLSYPKERVALFIRSDHNFDDTPHMIDVWLRRNAPLYHSVNVDIRPEPKNFTDNEFKINWPRARYQTVISHKEAALTFATDSHIPYVFFVDTDALLFNEYILEDLLAENKTIIAPLLQSRSAYSNFWGEMDDLGYYIRSSDYMAIVEREKTGTFPVALVHSAVLVRLEDATGVTFTPGKLDETGKTPFDDIITFARSAQKAGLEQFVTNKKRHGTILYSTETSNKENIELVNLKIDMTHKEGPLLLSESLYSLVRYPIMESLGVDQVYLINLQRREDRRERMRYCFMELGIRFQHFPAIDGQKMTAEFKRRYGIEQLEGYKDPAQGRNITTGEIGCFMSHYLIWMDILEKGYDHVFVFEDDIHFEPYFRDRVANLLTETGKHDLDFVYLGRKILANSSEPYLEGTESLVHVGYSYWTLSYYITKKGAQKLIDGQPLSKMVPVDEYIPIMFDRHPVEAWKEAFSPRNLNAASAHPLLTYPTHYTGEENYISDTEDSPLLDEIITETLELHGGLIQDATRDEL